jgi:hypothetical protein
MGKGTRIRWQSVAKLAAAVAACIALLAGLPTLLERPKAPPLPPDVGLAHVTAGAPAASLSHGREASPPRSRAPRDRRDRARPKRDRDAERPQRHRAPQADHDEASAPQPRPVAAPVAAPAAPPVTAPPAPSVPAPAPAPAPADSSPPPALAPVSTSSAPPPSDQGPADGGDRDQAGHPEFGFEH